MTTTPCDCEASFYGKVKELTTHDAPAPLGKNVVTIMYHDANLFYNVMTGGSVTGVLHMLNKTPSDWHRKNQSTVETTSCGSECSLA